MKLWELCKAGDIAQITAMLEANVDPNEVGQADQPVKF
jgi:hypothetical protein